MTPTSQDVFLDPTLMSAGAYNSIGAFRPDISFDRDVLDRFGEIIRRFNLQNEVGAVYVHRHFQMPRKSIAVTRCLPSGMTITRISSIKSLLNETIIGSAFKLTSENRFQAYEYSTQGPIPFLPTLFLEELARFLNENQLQEILGIFIRNEENMPRLTEFNLHDLRLSISIPNAEIPYNIQENASTTAWVYPKAQGSSIDGPKQCNDHSDDSHAPTVRMIETALHKRGIDRSWVFGY
jgi:hypothetical protein